MPKFYFEYDDADAYGSAVGVILGVVGHALQDDSMGQGSEEETMRAVRNALVERDPAVASALYETPQTLRELYDKASDGNV